MESDISSALFDKIKEGVVIVDQSGKILKTNRSFYAMHGIDEPFEKEYTINDSKNNFRLYDLDDREIPFEAWPFWKAVKGDFIDNLVCKCTNLSSGISFYGLFFTSSVKISNHTEAILISITDITDYIKVKQTIEEKEKLLSTIINNSQDGIHVLNLEKGQYDFMSPAQSRLTGFPITDLMFKVEEAATRLHPDDVEQVNQYLEKVISKEPPIDPVEYRWRVKTGEYRWFSDNRRAILEDGKPIKLVGISRDITEKKHHEEELKNLNELLTNMLYMAAHDIKSPIVNMKIMLQLLQESVGDIDLYLPKLNSSVNQLENVIEGLSKLIHAQVNNDVKVSSIYVKKEVEAVLSYNQAKLNECGGVLLNNIDDELSLNYIDQYFNSILSNLISNAIKYRDNQRSLQIVVRAERYDQQVKLTLSDNGVGMDLEHIGNKLFKPFSRFNSKVKGTGIGLYLINNLIRKNGGHIEVDSTPGQGTTFICYLNEYPLTRNDSSYKDINEKISDINSQRINDQQRS